MALTPVEEALVRELIDQKSALLSLADNEAIINSKIAVTTKMLNELIPVSSVSQADLMLLRQGSSDKHSTVLQFLNSAAFLQDGTGAVLRSLISKAKELVSVKDFGAVGNSTTDDTSAIQSAINYVNEFGGSLCAPAGKYRLTSELETTQGLTIHGVRPTIKGRGATDLLGGTWFYFDHVYKGFSGLNTGGYYTDITLNNIGTYRNQPAPAAAWTPNDHDFDVYTFGVADVILKNVTMLNATRGVCIAGDPVNTTGRLEVSNFRSQSFKTGIQIDTVYDVVRLDHIHIWPFWRDNMNVHTYTMDNLDAIYSLRNDNPMMSNLFSIFARAGLRIGQNANGGTSKMHVVNADFDRGVYGIWVDSTVTSGCSGQFANITHQGETGVALSKALLVEGNSCNLAFSSLESARSDQNAVRIEGTGNIVSFGDAKADNYDQSAGDFPAFEALTGNFMTFATRPRALNGGGIGGKFAPTGTIICDEWRSFDPVITSETGTITTLGTKSGAYKIVGNTVHVQVDFVITTNGTAAGYLKVEIPFGLPIRYFFGSGREIQLNGKSLSFTVNSGASDVIIHNYDNSYAGLDGGRYVGTFEYEINTGI